MFLAFTPQKGRAWYKHVYLMPWIVESVPQGVKEKLARSYPAPCLPEDQRRYQELAAELALNKAAKLRPTAPEDCVKGTPVTLAKVLSGGFTDDPDRGIDQDLDDSQDPFGDRIWMGGRTGPSSQGFRHQYWAGWKWTSPVATFQIPACAMGLARERAEAVAKKARSMIHSGDMVWGTRVLAWALHYIQDLAQPFHAVEVPYIAMVPWSAWFGWPMAEANSRLAAAMNHSLTNYHWAYEGYVLNRLEKGKDGPFARCLANPRQSSDFKYSGEGPFALADSMARVSVQLAPEVGQANYEFFGSELKDPKTSLPRNQNVPNYNEIAVSAQLSDERKFLEEVTCAALSNASWASHRLIEWAFSK